MTSVLAIWTLYLVARQRLGIFDRCRAGRFRIGFIDRLARNRRFRLGGAIRFRAQRRSTRSAALRLRPSRRSSRSGNRSICGWRTSGKRSWRRPGGVGTWISVMISPGARTVLPGTLTSKKFSALILRVLVTTVAFKAMRAGAISLGWTAMHLLTLPKIE